MNEIRLMTLDPGHFHAALVQKEMYPGISPRCAVFAPLGADLIDHLARIVRFNARPENPTCWELEIHAAPDYLARMLAAPPGNVVILSGRNRGKIEYIRCAVEAGLNVLADKPWIIRPEDAPALAQVLDDAARKGLAAYDIMTERYEITSMLQRDLVGDPEIFGEILSGSVDNPAVSMQSIHHIRKTVAGVPLKRPAWFFDIHEQGEGLSDVGVHLVDLAQWTLFPDQAIDWRSDIRILRAMRWPTAISREDFATVTGEKEFPESVRDAVSNGSLNYYCNNQVIYALRGVHIHLDALWHLAAPAGAGDTHYAVYRGSRSRIEVRQTAAERYRPELYVVPNRPGDVDKVLAALARRLGLLTAAYPGAGFLRREHEILVTIPEFLRIGHEAHFGQVAWRFFSFLRGEQPIPPWETPDMLAKYHVTTTGVEMSRRGGS
jgi:predicted dehydrogenase